MGSSSWSAFLWLNVVSRFSQPGFNSSVSALRTTGGPRAGAAAPEQHLHVGSIAHSGGDEKSDVDQGRAGDEVLLGTSTSTTRPRRNTEDGDAAVSEIVPGVEDVRGVISNRSFLKKRKIITASDEEQGRRHSPDRRVEVPADEDITGAGQAFIEKTATERKDHANQNQQEQPEVDENFSTSRSRPLLTRRRTSTTTTSNNRSVPPASRNRNLAASDSTKLSFLSRTTSRTSKRTIRSGVARVTSRSTTEEQRQEKRKQIVRLENTSNAAKSDLPQELPPWQCKTFGSPITDPWNAPELQECRDNTFGPTVVYTDGRNTGKTGCNQDVNGGQGNCKCCELSDYGKREQILFKCAATPVCFDVSEQKVPHDTAKKELDNNFQESIIRFLNEFKFQIGDILFTGGGEDNNNKLAPGCSQVNSDGKWEENFNCQCCELTFVGDNAGKGNGSNRGSSTSSGGTTQDSQPLSRSTEAPPFEVSSSSSEAPLPSSVEASSGEGQTGTATRPGDSDASTSLEQASADDGTMTIAELWTRATTDYLPFCIAGAIFLACFLLACVLMCVFCKDDAENLLDSSSSAGAGGAGTNKRGKKTITSKKNSKWMTIFDPASGKQYKVPSDQPLPTGAVVISREGSIPGAQMAEQDVSTSEESSAASSAGTSRKKLKATSSRTANKQSQKGPPVSSPSLMFNNAGGQERTLKGGYGSGPGPRGAPSPPTTVRDMRGTMNMKQSTSTVILPGTSTTPSAGTTTKSSAKGAGGSSVRGVSATTSSPPPGIDLGNLSKKVLSMMTTPTSSAQPSKKSRVAGSTTSQQKASKQGKSNASLSSQMKSTKSTTGAQEVVAGPEVDSSDKEAFVTPSMRKSMTGALRSGMVQQPDVESGLVTSKQRSSVVSSGPRVSSSEGRSSARNIKVAKKKKTTEQQPSLQKGILTGMFQSLETAREKAKREEKKQKKQSKDYVDKGDQGVSVSAYAASALPLDLSAAAAQAQAVDEEPSSMLKSGLSSTLEKSKKSTVSKEVEARNKMKSQAGGGFETIISQTGEIERIKPTASAKGVVDNIGTGSTVAVTSGRVSASKAMFEKLSGDKPAAKVLVKTSSRNKEMQEQRDDDGALVSAGGIMNRTKQKSKSSSDEGEENIERDDIIKPPPAPAVSQPSGFPRASLVAAALAAQKEREQVAGGGDLIEGTTAGGDVDITLTRASQQVQEGSFGPMKSSGGEVQSGEPVEEDDNTPTRRAPSIVVTGNQPVSFG
ncbi:unnamed protein product [Amoebophrya sp. A120]|nr:unnamed protein product [Amoebophrya sp. A120]|eukprot:GSA120T00014363001.1